MSLLDEYSDEYVVVNKITENDGYGGYKTVWSDGATFKAALAQASQSEVTVAGAMGEKVTHTMLIDKSLKFDYHTVVKRKSDNKIFRTTSRGDEVYTPASSGLNKRKINCEEWELPPDDEIAVITENNNG